MSDLSVLVLCGRSPRHLYVANRLCRAAHVLAIVHETGTQWTMAKLGRALRPRPLGRKLWRAARDRRRYADGGEARFFFGDAPPALEHPELVVEVPHINDPRVVELARRLAPDVVAVFGTSLIRGPLLSAGRLGIVNLHGGLSPEYRGADCTFWALYNGEPEKVGCTLHYIDAGIDTGKLIAHVCPEVGPGDDELTLFWRAVKASADVYAELLERLGRGEALGRVQPGKGRLYQVKDRLWRHERALAARLAAGMLDGAAMPARTTWFTAPPAGAPGPAGPVAAPAPRAAPPREETPREEAPCDEAPPPAERIDDRAWVVVRAYNEATVIRDVVAPLARRFANVVVVNDGSRDDTASQVRGLGVHVVSHAVNLGPGAALQTGISYALAQGAQWIVNFDADGQHRVADAVKIVAALKAGDGDAVFGSRFLGSAENMPRLRKWVLKAGIVVTRVAQGTALTDAHNGLRGFSRRAAAALDLTQGGMAYASQLIAQLHDAGVRIREIPVTIDYTEYSLRKGQSSMNALNIVIDLAVGRFLK